MEQSIITVFVNSDLSSPIFIEYEEALKDLIAEGEKINFVYS